MKARSILHSSEIIAGSTESFAVEGRYCDLPARAHYRRLTIMSQQARFTSAKYSGVYHTLTTYRTIPIWYGVSGLPSPRNLQPANTQASITPSVYHSCYGAHLPCLSNLKRSVAVTANLAMAAGLARRDASRYAKNTIPKQTMPINSPMKS